MKFVWPESARTELRAIDREVAVRILRGLAEYGASGRGDIKALAGQWQGHFRLRVGDYRIVFTIAPEEIKIVRIRHRSDISIKPQIGPALAMMLTKHSPVFL